MNKAVFAVDRIQNAMTCNRFLYWGSRIPGAGAVFSDRVFGDQALKQTVGRVALGLKWVYAFGGKLIYLFLCCGLPLFLPYGPDLLDRGFPMFVQALFFLSFLTGCFLQSDLLTPTLLKYTCVRQMYMPAGACAAATTGKLHAVTALTFTPGLMAAAAAFGQSPLAGLLLSAELAAVRLIAEWLWLILYDKTKVVMAQKIWFLCLAVVTGLLGAYLPLVLETSFPMDRILLHPVTVLVLLVLGAAAGRGLVRYPGYRALYYDRCKAENVLTASNKAAAQQKLFQDVKLRDSDLGKEPEAAALEKHKGYDYLNLLFFLRHRRMLIKPLQIELAILAGVFALGLLGVILFREEAAALLALVPDNIRFFVFIMYFTCSTMGTRVCKAMFYNCDISLLRYGWYREPPVVLKNFKVRLKKMVGLNLVLGGAICLAVVALMLAAGVPLSSVDDTLLPFILGILSLSVFFAVHPLFLYYVFQPYTTQLAVKNPFFNFLNFAVYAVCYGCFYIRQAPAGFAFMVLTATVLYCAVALLLVWKRAPKTFRVK